MEPQLSPWISSFSGSGGDDTLPSDLQKIKNELEQIHEEAAPPWINEEGEQTWSNNRVMCAKVILSTYFEMLMGIVIVFNFILIIFETDQDGTCFPEYSNDLQNCPTKASGIVWLGRVNLSLLTIYTVESFLRLFAFRSLYLCDKWNYMDLVIVLSGWLQETMGNSMNLAMLRIFRLARLFRAFRIFSKVRELYLLISGFASSCKAIFWGMLMLSWMLVVFSILMVELVHPVNSEIVYSSCPDCSSSFRTVYWSTFTLFKEVVAGGSWIISTPMIERSPHLGVLLVFVVILISLGMMNLILSVIVERAAEARDKDEHDRIQQEGDAANEMKMRLLRMCGSMDKDGSFSLTVDELKEAFEEVPDFRHVLKLMHIRKKDLTTVFGLLDADNSGSIDYKEFCEELYLLSLPDQRWAVANTKRKVDDLRKTLDAKLDEVLSQIHTTAQSQERQLRAIELKINRPMPMENIMEHPSSISPPLPWLQDGVCESSKLTDADFDKYACQLQSTFDTLKEHLRQIVSSQLHVAAEVHEQAAVLQRQADFMTQVCESASVSSKVLQHTLPEKINDSSPGERTQRLDILMDQGSFLGHTLAALQHEATRLGFSVDKAGELIALFGRASNAAGLGPFPVEPILLDRISQM